LYSPERVERLRAFSDLLIENAVLRRDRLDLVERLQSLLLYPDILQKINEVVREATITYPDHTISVSLMDELANARVAPNDIPIKALTPWKETYCQYVIASGKPFEVTDSFNDLVVCQSPNASQVRSYSGVPLIVRSFAIGVICLYSDKPRESWDFIDQTRMTQWAVTVIDILETELSQQS
jgi:GAF domain-containing protein